MRSSRKYYEESLYPLQDGILSIVKASGIPFYLTGGTALSRHYFDHRYSDDIDLFINRDPRYAEHVLRFLDALSAEEEKGRWTVDRSRQVRDAAFTQLYIMKSSAGGMIVLKVDIVNDTVPHYGENEQDPVLGEVDNLRNMLSNKISAVYRFEPKDLADIREIARHLSFDWAEIIEEAKSKEGAVDPRSLFNILNAVPEDEMAAVLWTRDMDLGSVKKDLAVIASDILYGRPNTLRVTA